MPNRKTKKTKNQPQPSTTKKKKTNKLRLIDCDVHHTHLNDEVLFPYLPRHYVEYIKDFGSMLLPNLGHTNMPGNGSRLDLWVDQDNNPAYSVDIAREKHLDAYDIDIAVLTGGPYNVAVHSDVDYAAAYCRAFNDWPLEHWGWRQHIRFGTQPMIQPLTAADLETFLQWLHADEVLLYASDYPHWDWDEPSTLLAGFDKKLRRRVMVENAKEFYGFS